jgi:lysozyme
MIVDSSYFVDDVAPAAATPTAQPKPQLESSWLNTLAGTAASAGQGIFGGFLDEMAAVPSGLAGLPFAATDVLGNLLSGQQADVSGAWSQNVSDPYYDSLTRNQAGLAAFREQAPVVSTVSEIGGAILSPINKLKLLAGGGKIAQAAASGGLQSAIYGAGNAEGNENIVSEAAKGAGLGVVAGGGIQALGSMLQGAGGYATGLARSTKNKLYNLGAAELGKSSKKGVGGTATMSQAEMALDRLIKQGDLVAGDVAQNALNLEVAKKELGDQVSSLLSAADNVQPSKVNIDWTNTKKYIAKDITEGLQDDALAVMKKISDPIENSAQFVSEVDHQRRLLQEMGESALGDTGTDSFAKNIYKYMGLDLKQAVGKELKDPVYKQALGDDAFNTLTALRKKQSDVQTLFPIFKEKANKLGGGATATEAFKGLTRTSGGYGVPMLLAGGGVGAGVATGNLPLALAALGGGAFLESNAGQKTLAALLKGAGGATSAVGSGLGASALPASRVLADMITQSAGGEAAAAAPMIVESDFFMDDATPPADTALPTTEAAGVERTSFIPEEMPEMTLTSDSGIDFIKKHEGLRLTAYDDGTGKQTIGYGHTKDVPKSITKEEAEEKLVQDIESHEQAVKEAVKVPLTQEQFDALTSFTFNLGAGALKRSSLVKKLNAGDYEGAADEFLKWDKARIKGKLQPLRGLTKRRQAERELFLSGIGKDLITV